MSRNAAEIFLEAREMPAAKRTAYLVGACGKDLALRAKVEALLKADAEAGSFMAAPRPPAGAEPAADAAGEHAGAQIGRFKLLERIGEGGMGTIWMAEQREPVRRRVALKIIKLGMDTKQVIARFEAERQALAMMDHPNIAKVFDAGATETGRPYFVMEYIKGIPILEYCDQEKVDTRARLELFIHVCHAIQHAHHKGIIHRDIKPSNVLVTLHDGTPVPKVIDFGVAKATNSELTTKTLFTEHRQMIGTPAYMSPEQAEMSGLDIDTRSDVYSLGVLLYELLTGTTPFDMRALLESGFAEMMRTIREVEPHKPSTRISTLGDTGTRTAQQRRSDVKRLSTLLRGDLDWIVMKCLEKDRTRRYDTANGIAADLDRHLNDETVTAGAPSAGHRLRKFVRRNRVQVVAGGLILGALLIGLVATSWGLVQTSHARSARLLLQLEDERRSSAERARLGRNAEAVAALLGECEAALRAGDASKATVALDAARKRNDEGGADDEAGRLTRLTADLDLLNEFDAIDQFKWTWANGSFPNPAQAAQRDHEALRRYGADPEFVSVEDAVARVDASAIRGRIVLVMNWIFLSFSNDRANALLDVLQQVDSDAFRDEFRIAVLADDPPKFQALAKDVALLEQPPEFTAALGQSHLISIEQRRELMEMATFRRPDDLALSMALQGTYKSSEPQTANERIRWLQAVLAADPQYFAAYINLGIALLDAQRPEEAAACDRRALELAPRSDHPQILANLGVVLETQGKFDEAIACDRKALEIDPNDATAHNNLGVLLARQGKSDEALACWRETIELDPKYPRVHGRLAEELSKRGRLEEAVVSYRKAIELEPKLPYPVRRLAELLDSLGRTEEAIPWYRKSLELEPTAYVYACLGRLLRMKGQLDEAVALFRKAIEIAPEYDAYGGLGVTLKLKGQMDEAIALMRKSVEMRPDNADGMRVLGETLLAVGQKDEALSWVRKAVERDPKDALAWMDLGAILDGMGRLDESIVCARKAIELDPSDFRFHHNLGVSQVHAGRPAEAVASYRKAAELNPKNAANWHDLSQALLNSGQRDAAFECVQRAVELDPRLAVAQYSMGWHLQEQQRWDEAIARYRKAIEIDPDYAEANCNLAICIACVGRFAEALPFMRRGHEAGSKRPGWSHPSAEWLRQTEIKAALEEKLPALLAGEIDPVDNAERLEYAQMCWRKGLLHAEVKLLSEAIANDPTLVDDLAAGHRYDAACSAARASAGLGKDASGLDDAERARLRRQAIDWLRADLALHAKRSESRKPEERRATKETLRKWREDAELACIRDPEQLDLLPDDDHAALEELWLDVADLIGDPR
jgi:tetratricopeptide (TPR) repeat protein